MEFYMYLNKKVEKTLSMKELLNFGIKKLVVLSEGLATAAITKLCFVMILNLSSLIVICKLSIVRLNHFLQKQVKL